MDIGIIIFNQNSVAQWKQRLEANSEAVTIKCGLYQCNALTLQLYCIGVNSLRNLVKKSGKRYRCGILMTIRDHLHMDVIKLYARREQDVGTVIHSAGSTHEDIRMSFRWDKCGPIGQNGAKCGNVTQWVGFNRKQSYKGQLQVLGYLTSQQEL